MSYAWDVVETLIRTRRVELSTEQRNSVILAANIAINTSRRDWFERMMEHLAAEASIPRAAAEKAWREVAYYTSSLQYLQLGNPDDIWITPVEAGDDQEAADDQENVENEPEK